MVVLCSWAGNLPSASNNTPVSALGVDLSTGGVANQSRHLLDRTALVGITSDVGVRLEIIDVDRALEVVVFAVCGCGAVVALWAVLAILDTAT